MAAKIPGNGLRNMHVFLAMALTAYASVLSAAETASKQAKEILSATGVKGGLVVHRGCGDGKVRCFEAK